MLKQASGRDAGYAAITKPKTLSLLPQGMRGLLNLLSLSLFLPHALSLTAPGCKRPLRAYLGAWSLEARHRRPLP